MMNRFFTIITAICCSVLFGSVELSLGNYSESDGTADVLYNSSEEIGGFQIGLEGASLTGASGGAAASNGFTMSSSPSTLLGFSFTGGSIPAGSGVMATLAFDDAESQVCIGSPVISSVWCFS